MVIPTHKKAWAAGIIDGEGYIVREKQSKKSTRITVRVDNTDTKMLQELSLYFGGNVYSQKPRKNHPDWSPTFYWRLVNKKAEIFLREVIPYLVTKKELAIKLIN